MFYVKSTLTEGTTIEIELTGEVFTRCPDCGAEMTFDLQELTADSNFDFYGTSIYCVKCSDQHRLAAVNSANSKA